MDLLKIYIGKHFKDQIQSRFKMQNNIIDYLNKTLPEGLLTNDCQFKGIYFQTAGAYVPIVNTIMNTKKILFAKTFQFKAFTSLRKGKMRPIKIIWTDDFII